jgi:hypothetical protein
MPFFGVPIRNGLPIGLGSSAGFGIAPFEPYSLFENGEQGAWYDPSDLSTLFDDSAGTTPVTGVEQFVGLMLDKSKGLVLGSELVDAASAVADWTQQGTNTIALDDGAIRITFVDNSVGADLTLTAARALTTNLTAGKTYRFSANVKVNTGSVDASIVSATTNPVIPVTSTSFQAISFYFVADGSNETFRPTSMGAGEIFWIKDVSVRELPGNHAFQTSSAKRPKLAARYNLLTYSEEFDNAAWTKDGGSFSGLLFTAGGAGNAYTYQLITTSAVAYTFTAKVKVGTANVFWLYFSNSANYGTAFFDVSDQTTQVVPGSLSSPSNLSVTDLGSGDYQISAQWTALSSANNWGVGISNAKGSTSVTVGKTGTIYNADIRPASQATGLIGPTYQRVAAATVYDTAGFLPYLAFDGLSWSMGTNSIDFSAGDKMTVWAGVRKLSDANTGTVAQLSPSTSTNNGVFGLYVPFNTGASADYAWQSKGTTRITVNSPVNIGPATSVFTGVGNISAPLAQLRQNAIQVATSSASQGTGNFGNFALNIGEGAGFLNGWLTSLIVRGAQSTQSQIEATEAWVNGKTGAY